MPGFLAATSFLLLEFPGTGFISRRVCQVLNDQPRLFFFEDDGNTKGFWRMVAWNWAMKIVKSGDGWADGCCSPKCSLSMEWL